MTYRRKKIIESLKKRGFTGNKEPFALYYWVHDGWYLHCDQVSHVNIGQNYHHVIRNCEDGINDQFLKPEIDKYTKNYLIKKEMGYFKEKNGVIYV